MEIKKLLFVTKFEELGFDALQSLLTLTNAALDHVVFVNVIERDRVAMRRGVGYQKEEEIRLRETANIRFIDWAEELFEKGMEVGVYIPVGSLTSEVIKAAQKEEADLIVIGRSDKSLLEHFYSGSDIVESFAELPFRYWFINRLQKAHSCSKSPSKESCWQRIGRPPASERLNI